MKNNVFKNKNFVLVFLGTLVSNFGATLYSFVVSFYILALTDNNTIIQGSYLAVAGIVTLIFTVIGGVLADHFYKAKIMYWCDYLKGALLIITTIIMVLFTNKTLILVLLFVIGVIGNIFSGIFAPASGSLLPAIVEKEDLQQANSYFSILTSIQGIIGIVLAGVLYSLVPINIIFFIVGGCYVASAISEMFIKYEFKAVTDKLTLKKSLKEIGDGCHYIFNNKGLFSLTAIALFINFFLVPIFSNYLPFFISNDLSTSEYLFKNLLSPVMWGSVIEVLSLTGLIVGSVVVSLIHYKKASNMIKGALIAFVIALIAVSISNLLNNDINNNINFHLVVLCCASILTGSLTAITNIPANTSIQMITDEEMMGRVNGAIGVGTQGLTPLASLLGGIIIAGFGSSILLFVCTLGFLLTTIFAVRSKHFSTL